MSRFLSVIVPVYNSAGFVGKLVEKLMEYESESVEFVFVNDGSADNTKEVLEAFKEKDCRIRIISQENGGVSSARNTGIENADGEYIWFVDADDNVTDNALQEITEHLARTKTDMLLFDFILIDKPGTRTYKTVFDEEAFELTENANEFLIKKILNRKIRNSVWGAIFRKSIIDENNITFPVGITNGEDGIFFTEYTDKINTATYVTKQYYYYDKTNENSASRKITEKVFESLKASYIVKSKYISVYGNETIQNSYRDRLVASVFRNLVWIKRNKNIDRSRFEKIVSDVAKDDFFKKELSLVKPENIEKQYRSFLKLFLTQKVKAICRMILMADVFHRLLLKIKGR